MYCHISPYLTFEVKHCVLSFVVAIRIDLVVAINCSQNLCDKNLDHLIVKWGIVGNSKFKEKPLQCESQSTWTL